MIRGLYTSAAGMVAQQRRQDTITTNIANINTPGYRARSASLRTFPDVMMYALGGEKQTDIRKIGHLATGVFAEEPVIDFRQGDLQETGSKADFALESKIDVPGLTFDANGRAINGDGNTQFRPQAFFAIQDGAGVERYTRSSRFIIDGNGHLATQAGDIVLGRDGKPLQFNVSNVNATLNDQGTFIDVLGEPLLDKDGKEMGLKVVVIDNPHDLLPINNGLFALGNGQSARNVTDQDNVVVRQGFIERANVDPAQSMVDMMTAVKAYEANQKMIQYADRTLEKAVNEIGKV